MLRFGEELRLNEVRLVEMEEGVVDGLADGVVSFVGNQEVSEEVYVVDRENTYVLKRVENSNTLVLSDLDVNEINISVDHSYILELTNPMYGKVEKLLESKVINMSEYKPENTEQGLSIQTLMKSCICSEIQLLDYLQQINCIKFGAETYGILSEQDREYLIDSILHMIISNKLDPSNIPLNSITSHFTTLHPDLLSQFLSQIGSLSDSTFHLNFSQIYKRKVRELFNTRNTITLHSLITKISQTLPHQITFKKDYLTGLAIPTNSLTLDHTDLTTTLTYLDTNTIKSLPAHKLFSKLFNLKPEWLPEDITIYIAHLSTPQLNSSQILSKHASVCRSSSDFNKRVLRIRK